MSDDKHQPRRQDPPQVTSLRLAKGQQWWWHTIEDDSPRSAGKPSPIVRRPLVKPGSSVTAQLMRHYVFGDKDNGVKFLLENPALMEKNRQWRLPGCCLRWMVFRWTMAHTNTHRVTESLCAIAEEQFPSVRGQKCEAKCARPEELWLCYYEMWNKQCCWDRSTKVIQLLITPYKSNLITYCVSYVINY